MPGISLDVILPSSALSKVGQLPSAPMAFVALKELHRIRERLTVLFACERMSWFRRVNYLRCLPEERLAEHYRAAMLLGRQLDSLMKVLLQAEASNDLDESNRALVSEVKRVADFLAENLQMLRLFKAIAQSMDLLQDALRAQSAAGDKIGRMTTNFYRRRKTPNLQFPPAGRKDQVLNRIWKDCEEIWKWTHDAGPINVLEIGCGAGRVSDSLGARHIQWRQDGSIEIDYTGVDCSLENLEHFLSWLNILDMSQFFRSIRLLLWDGSEEKPPRCLYNGNRRLIPSVVWTQPQGTYIFVANVLHEIPLKTLPTFLEEIKKVLNQNGIIVFCETQSLTEIEDQYVLWAHEDFAEVLGKIGFVVLTVTSCSGKGFPVTYCYATLRKDYSLGEEQPEEQARLVCKDSYQKRLHRISMEIADLNRKRQVWGLTQSESFRHLHAVMSLTNIICQIEDNRE